MRLERRSLIYRSICVGQHVANDSLFIDIAISLWAFSLANVEGQELNADNVVDEGTIM